MNIKFGRIVLLIFAGWLLGYMHHYHASADSMAAVRSETETLREELKELELSLPVIKKVNVKATAYSNDPVSINVSRWRDGLTATNKRAMRGRVAADWRVFPPGTRLYIPGYGEAVVEDRGAAVTGNHIDLFVDSKREAIEWGVKKIDIYVLGKATS